jgi:hypothetical protein
VVECTTGAKGTDGGNEDDCAMGPPSIAGKH